MAEGNRPDEESDLDEMLEERAERQRRASNRMSWLLFGPGCAVTVVGVGLWLGNVTGAFPTVPLAGYLTIVFGGFLCWLSRQTGQHS
jgi:hypothetical protein